MLEQRAVVPPTLVGTVHVEVLLVFVDLHRNPNTVLPTKTVVLGENLLSFGVLAASVEPARRFGEEPSQEENQCREENLQPDGYCPTRVAGKVDGATSDTSSEERADEPVAELGSNMRELFEPRLTRKCCRDQ